MQSIFTKCLPATNTKPTRIKAWASGWSGRKPISIIRSYRHDSSDDDEHLVVARELAQKLGWSGRFIEGSAEGGRGNVYVIDCGRGFIIGGEDAARGAP